MAKPAKETLSNYVTQLKQIDEKYRLLQCAFYIIAVLSPFAMAAMATRADGYSLLQIFPYFNDEAMYFLQLHGMIEFGAPLGYNGYAGSHALISTFGFHGFGVLIPYFIFASIFGLNFYTVALVGMFMMSAAILFYVLALRPDVKQLAFFVLCTSMGALFMHMNMMESGFYAYMIILATLMIRINRRNELSYKIAALIFLVFVSFAKPTFAPFMFLLLMLIVKNKRWYVNAIISLIGMAFFTVAAYVVFRLFSAPYFSSHMVFSPYDIASDFFGTVSSILSGLVQNFFYLLPFEVQRGHIHGMYIAVLLYFILFLLLYFSVIEIVTYLKTKEFKHPREARLMFMLTITMIGFIMLWTVIMDPTDGQTIKSITPIILFMSTAISAMEIRKKSHFISLFAIIGAIIIVFSGWIGIYGKTYATEEVMNRVEATRQFYEESVTISPEKSRWENTIASYLLVGPDFYWLNAPAGAGWNLYLTGRTVRSENEKYVLIPHNYYDIIEHHLMAGYVEINNSETVVLLLNPKYLP